MDNSRYFEEKFNEGYNQRDKEIFLTDLILIESQLYEPTPDELKKFYRIRRGGDNENRDNWYNSLDYIRDNCKCINNKVHAYNY